MKISSIENFIDGVGAIVAIIVFIVVGITVGLNFSEVVRTQNDTLDNGVLVYGTVIEKEIFSSHKVDEPDSYWVKYRYTTTNGKSVTYFTFLNNKPTFDKLNIGSRIEIAYDPDNPQYSIPTSGAQTSPLWIVFLAAPVLAFAALMISYGLIQLIKRVIIGVLKKLDSPKSL